MRGSARVWFGVLALTASCFSTPTRPEGLASDARTDATGDAGQLHVPTLTVTPGAKLVVGTDDYTMKFQAGGWALPESLVMNDRPAVERLSFAQPYDENAIGVTLWPAYTVNAGSLALNGGAIRSVISAGPVKAVVEVRWNGPEHCTGTGALVNNLSRFTFYPDGRIVRHDEVVTKAACGNNLGTVNAFAWNPGMSASYDANGTTVSFPAQPPQESYVGLGRIATGSACLQEATSAIGFTWFPPNTDDGWEKIEMQLLPTTFGTALFWAEDVDTMNGRVYVADTTLFIRGGGTTCTDLQLPLAAQQTPPTLANAAFRDDGSYRIAGPGSATAQGDFPAGFAVEYETTADVTIRRVSALASRTRALVSGEDYLEQQDGTIATFFMIDQLFSGEQLVFSP